MTLQVGVRSGGEVATATSPPRAPITLPPREPWAVQTFIAAHSIDGDGPGLPGRDPLATIDAVNECEHGRLSGDRTEPCGCFPHETHRERPLPPAEPIEEMEEVSAVETETSVPSLEGDALVELPQFVEQLVDEIDAEIERLRGVRAAIIEGVSRVAV